MRAPRTRTLKSSKLSLLVSIRDGGLPREGSLDPEGGGAEGNGAEISLLIGSGSGILGCVFVYSYILPTLYLVRILATCGHGPRVPSSSNAGDK